MPGPLSTGPLGTTNTKFTSHFFLAADIFALDLTAGRGPPDVAAAMIEKVQAVCSRGVGNPLL